MSKHKTYRVLYGHQALQDSRAHARLAAAHNIHSGLMCLELDFMITAVSSMAERVPGAREVYEPALAEHAYRIWWFEKQRGNL